MSNTNRPNTRSSSPNAHKSRKDTNVVNSAGNNSEELVCGNAGTGAGSKQTKPELESMKIEMKGMFDSMFRSFKKEISEITEIMNSRFDQLEDQFKTAVEEIKEDISELKSDVLQVKGDISEVQSKIKDVEDGMNEHTVKIDEIEEKVKQDINSLRDEMLEKVEKNRKELEKQYLLREKHDRKYSLLLYGVQQERSENIFAVVRRMFVEDLHLEQSRVDNMYFANAHRLYSTAPGPKPIIVKFLCFDDRELVFSMAKELAGTKKRILSDLPVLMKNERHRLAKKAYEIRQAEKVYTRIRDKDLDIWLEVKEGDHWVKRDV